MMGPIKFEGGHGLFPRAPSLQPAVAICFATSVKIANDRGSPIMPRISAAEKAARMWRTAAKPPKPPSDFARPARDLWRTLASSRDPTFWTRPAQLLLRRLVLTAVSAEATQRAYDAEMLTPRGAMLARQLTGLNASVLAFSRQLRLSPLQNNRVDATRRNADRSPLLDDPLIGGAARHGPRR
jgi:hypothetical protein